MGSQVLTEADMVLRLALGFVAGAIMGFERASSRQVAGMRTHILIALGATLLMLLSIWLPLELTGIRNGDPGRIAAQVVSGIGFLGAGAILRLGNNVRGLTTAASLWFVAAVGLTIGAGMFLAAGIAEAAGLITLMFLGRLERKIFPSERFKTLEISYKTGRPNISEAQDTIRAAKIRIQSMDVVQGSINKPTKLRLLVGIPTALDIASIAQALKSLDNVTKVEIKEKY
jgi:putative Mg2+ transporter-C (MgtC) family protein